MRTSSGLARLGVTAALVVSLAGCTGDDEPSLGSTVTQVDVLADGEVTAAEYRRAIDAHAACINESGFEATEPHLAADGLIWQIGVSATSESQDVAVQAVLDGCYDQYVDDVEREYFQANVPTGAERDALFEKLIGCLADVGVNGVTRLDTEEEIVRAIAEQQADDMSPGLWCLDDYRLVFPEGIFGG